MACSTGLRLRLLRGRCANGVRVQGPADLPESGPQDAQEFMTCMVIRSNDNSSNSSGIWRVDFEVPLVTLRIVWPSDCSMLLSGVTVDMALALPLPRPTGGIS